MKNLLPLAILLLASACQQDKPAAPAPSVADRAAPAPAVKPAVPSLEGKWRLTAPAALDLSFSDGKATLSAGCVRRGYTYTQKGNGVTFASYPAGSASCGRTPSVAEETAFAALTDVNLAIFDADGRTATLSGLSGPLSIERR